MYSGQLDYEGFSRAVYNENPAITGKYDLQAAIDKFVPTFAVDIVNTPAPAPRAQPVATRQGENMLLTHPVQTVVDATSTPEVRRAQPEVRRALPVNATPAITSPEVASETIDQDVALSAPTPVQTTARSNFVVSVLRAYNKHDYLALSRYLVPGQVNYFGHRDASLSFIRNDMTNDARTYAAVNCTYYPDTLTHEVSNLAYDRWCRCFLNSVGGAHLQCLRHSLRILVRIDFHNFAPAHFDDVDAVVFVARTVRKRIGVGPPNDNGGVVRPAFYPDVADGQLHVRSQPGQSSKPAAQGLSVMALAT